MRGNISYICSAKGGYFANLFTLTQVYAGVVVGTHRPSHNADGGKCNKELCWVNKLCTEVGNKLRNFFGCGRWCGVTLVCAVAAYEKKPPVSRRLCIHGGGDEGNRTPDLLTASQALSQLSYAPVTRRYYRGRFLVVQEVFWVDLLTYGFSWDGAEIITLRAIISIRRPDKTLMGRLNTC